MKEGKTMANRNGMGPMNQGPLTGRGLGNCGTGSNIGKIGLGIGAGLGMAWGCRRGLGRGRGVRGGGLGQGGRGFWQTTPTQVKESLAQYKEELKQELANVEEQLTNKVDE